MANVWPIWMFNTRKYLYFPRDIVRIWIQWTVTRELLMGVNSPPSGPSPHKVFSLDIYIRKISSNYRLVTCANTNFMCYVLNPRTPRLFACHSLRFWDISVKLFLSLDCYFTIIIIYMPGSWNPNDHAVKRRSPGLFLGGICTETADS